MIVDSHCHLDYAELYDQLNEVVKRAVLSQVNYLLTICTTPESFKRILLILKKYKNIYGTYGIHPHETQKYKNIDSSFISKVKKNIKKSLVLVKLALIFFITIVIKKFKKKFIEHIKAASELNVPIIVHSRNAETDTYEILKSEEKNSNLKILMHCFTGSKDFAKKLLDINCYISVSGIITFKNSTELSETISSIPIENLLIETDSPYLAPNPYRGKTNEPSFILHTIEKLSQIKQVTKESIMFNTTTNFKKLFNFI